MRFLREELTPELFEEMLPLFYKHWREIAHYQDIELNPDINFYESANRIGMLRIFTAREQEKLCGYCVYLVKQNPHYKDSKQASQDILFMDPEMRGNMQGFKFIRWCDTQLSVEGVQAVYQHVKTKHNFGPALERMGYELVDLIYAKRLDKKESL